MKNEAIRYFPQLVESFSSIDHAGYGSIISVMLVWKFEHYHQILHDVVAVFTTKAYLSGHLVSFIYETFFRFYFKALFFNHNSFHFQLNNPFETVYDFTEINDFSF